MGESKEELNSIKTCDFQAIFIAQSAETLQEASVSLLEEGISSFQSFNIT